MNKNEFGMKKSGMETENLGWLERNGFRRLVPASRHVENGSMLNTWVSELPDGWSMAATLDKGEWQASITHESLGKFLDLDMFTGKSAIVGKAAERAMAKFSEFLDGIAGMVIGKKHSK